MYLRIIGNAFTENLLKEISVITDQALLFFRKLKYDEKERTVVFPIERYAVLGKRKFLGSRMPYKYNKNIKFQTSITIRKVTECKIINNVDDPGKSHIIIMFGMEVKNNNIIITSLEEHRGTTRYAMVLTVSELDIEISDRTELGSGA